MISTGRTHLGKFFPRPSPAVIDLISQASSLLRGATLNVPDLIKLNPYDSNTGLAILEQ